MVVTIFTCLRCKEVKYYNVPNGFMHITCKKCKSIPNRKDRFNNIPDPIISTISKFLYDDVVADMLPILQFTISDQFEKYKAFFNRQGHNRNMLLFCDIHKRWTETLFKNIYRLPLKVLSNDLSNIRLVNKQFDSANKHVFEETLDGIQRDNQDMLNNIQHRVALITEPN